jgi:phage baseplate assembly protein W
MATDPNGVVIGAIPSGVPHLTIPFTIGYDGTASVLEQDTSDEIVQSVAMCVGSEPGQRLLVPNYGVVDPTFAGINTSAVIAACGRWEPRATVSIQATPGGTEKVVVGVKGGS